jgi:hypothetical protein
LFCGYLLWRKVFFCLLEFLSFPKEKEGIPMPVDSLQERTRENG